MFLGFACSFILINLCILNGRTFAKNNRPMIGVPAMAITDKLLLEKVPKLKGQSYIAASYIKLIEMAGARAVPIPTNLKESRLKYIFKSINGLLFPGGEVNLEDSGYHTTSKKLFEMAIEENKKGIVFPVLGICRGMQALMVYANGDDIAPLKSTNSSNYTTTLTFTENAENSYLFGDLTEEMKQDAETKDITAHFHIYGVNPKDLPSFPEIDSMFNVLATSKDRNNVHFISAIEGKKLPFYGVQYHPEKPMFEWAETINIPHCFEAIRFSQKTANLFVQKARENDKKFQSYNEERLYGMNRHMPFDTSNMVQSHTPFNQIYLFK